LSPLYNPLVGAGLSSSGTDTADGSLNGAAVLSGLAPTIPAAAGSANNPVPIPAEPLSGDVGTGQAVPSGAVVPPVRLALAPHAQDALFEAWDTETDSLALNWK
jgi:hypothetical protein